jgi:Spy/CpxP family protein refolding chaperone
MGRSLLAGFVFFAIFVAGGVAGYFFGFRWATKLHEADGKKDHQQQAIAVPYGPMVLKHFAEQLDLTREQREQIRPIIVQYMEQMRALGGERDNAMQHMQEEVDKVLTFDQRVKLEKLKDEQRARLLEQQERVRRFLIERSGKGGLPPAPPQNPPPAPAPAQPPSSPSPSTAIPPTESVPVH